jgi:Na+/proline symporter
MAFIPLSYSLVFGIRASIITDYVKMVFILGIGLFLIPEIVAEVGFDRVLSGLSGRNGIEFWSSQHWNLFLSFGLPVSIGLLSGPFGDQSFWQRAFATKKQEVGRSFVLASLLFGIVPLLLGTLGFVAAGSNLAVDNPGLVNFEVVMAVTGLVGACIFFFMVMSAITSILDSKLCAISSIAGHDVAERYGINYRDSGRGSMLFLTLGALLLANVPDLKVLHLFLFYGTVRATTFLPTVLLLLRRPLSESSVFYGILGALIFGLPVFAYGNFNGLPLVTTCGSLFTLLFPVFTHVLQKIAK